MVFKVFEVVKVFLDSFGRDNHNMISNKKVHRATASQIYQICSGHVPLNAYLHRFKIKDSAQCPACRAPKETPQHFIMECPAYAHERWKLKPKKGRTEIKYTDLLSSQDKTIQLAHYILDTRCFEQGDQDKETTSEPKWHHNKV
jgi:hypothetical protein